MLSSTLLAYAVCRKGANKLTVLRCIRTVFRDHGLKGFYKGLTASYMGISETVLNFVIYEKLKERIVIHERGGDPGRVGDPGSDRSAIHFLEFMVAAGISKTIACISFYPHG